MRIGRTLPPAAAPIYRRDILSGIKGLLNGHRELDRFETELKDYFGVQYCFLVSSGKAALSIILQALKDIQPERDEVLIPAFTCYSVPSSIVRAGLKVKLCDIDPDTLDFDFGQLSEILSQRSPAKGPNKPNKPNGSNRHGRVDRFNQLHRLDERSNRLLAIIPTHLFGLPSDIERLRNLIDNPEIIIVEDAAQTMGGEWKGKKLGTMGDVSFFSLGRGKALSTLEGGIILTDRADIADKIALRIHTLPKYGITSLTILVIKSALLSLFLHPSLFWLPKALPFLKLGETIYDPHFKIKKMTPFQAGLAKDWLYKIRRFKECRSVNIRQWALATKTNHLCNYVSQNGRQPDLLRFPVRVGNTLLRKRILIESESRGLGIMTTFPDSIDGIQALGKIMKLGKSPVAKELAGKLITLPVHPFLTENDKRRIEAMVSQISDRKG